MKDSATFKYTTILTIHDNMIFPECFYDTVVLLSEKVKGQDHGLDSYQQK